MSDATSLLLTMAALIFGYALGYAKNFKEFEKEIARLHTEVSFWKNLSRSWRKSND